MPRTWWRAEPLTQDSPRRFRLRSSFTELFRKGIVLLSRSRLRREFERRRGEASMTAAEMIQIIEKGSAQYFSGLVQEVRSNLGTNHYRRLSEEELSRRITAVYLNLEHWIATRDEAAVRVAGETLGKRRFEEGIPLGQVVLALVLEENYLRKYLGNQGVSPERSEE